MTTNLNDLISNTNVRQFIFTTDLIKGTNYDKEKVNFEGKKILEKDSKTITCYHFEVDSESKPTYYDVYIYIKVAMKSPKPYVIANNIEAPIVVNTSQHH